VVVQTWAVRSPDRFELADAQHVRVRLVGGGVDLLTHDGPPLLTVSRVSGAPLQVSTAGDVVEVRHDLGMHRRWYRDLPPAFLRRCRLALSLPPACSIEVETVAATIVAAGPLRSAELTTVKGEILLDRVGPDLRAKTVSAQIVVRNCFGRVGLRTVSGELTLVAGDEDVDAQLTSVAGSIVVGVDDEPDGAGLDVELTSANGHADTQLPSGTPGLEALVTPEGNPAGLRLRRGDGTRPVRIRGATVSGRVALVLWSPHGPEGRP
jgi:hypothetical protein